MASAAAASSAAGAGPASGDLPPNQTLYVNNLNDKIKRADMKKTLYTSFSQFGRVMQIICKGSFKLKGQAWITFDDVSSAVTAKRQLTNCPIFGKPLRVRFAKEACQAVAHRMTAVVRAGKRGRDAADSAAAETEPAALRSAVAGQKDAGQSASAAAAASQVLGAAAASSGAASSVAAAAEAAPAAAPAGGTLVVTGLPAEVEPERFAAVFSGFPGFAGSRLPPGGKGVGFVDFADEATASVALRAMQGYQITDAAAITVSLSA